MSNKLKKYKQKIAVLEANNRRLKQRLTAARKSGNQTRQELQKAREAFQNIWSQPLDCERFLRLAMDNIPQAVFWKDCNSVYLGCNQHFATIAGLSSPTEIIGKTDFDLPWKPAEAEFFREGDRRVMESDTPELGIIEPQQQADGCQCWLETNKIPLHDFQGNVIGIMGTFADISDRKAAEQALQKKDILLQMTLEAGKMGCWSWNRYTNEVIWSDGVEGILGLIPNSFGGTFEDYVALIHPEDLDRVVQVIEQTLKAEREYNIQHRIVLPNGEIQWLRAIGGIWRNDEGEAIGLLGSVLNDTQYKAAEIALIESTVQIHQQIQREQLLNQIANQIRTSLDLNRILNTTVREIQRFLEVDRCHFAWYVEQAGEAYWDVIAEVQTPGLPSFVGKHRATNFGALSELLLCEQIIQLDDTATVRYPALQAILTALENKSMLVLPVRAESGKFGIIACIHHRAVRLWRDDEVEFLEAVVDQVAIALNQADLLAQSQARARELEELLTQLQHTQTQLIQSEKMSSLGQLVAGVAHEINNPVGFIHGNISHAEDYMGDLMRLIDLYQQHYPQPHPEILEARSGIELEFLKEDLYKLFRSMQVGTERIREIVKSLRTFSRLDEAEIKRVDLHDGIDSTLTILQTRLRAQDWRPPIRVIKDYTELPHIECYAGQLNQVFMNILSNAIDALEERDRDRTPGQMQENPSTICIQTRVVDQNAVIRMTDNGPGMSNATKARLFDPFFTTKPVGRGTGLGLSISYQIVTEKHRGHLRCTSRPGETTLIVEIPIQKKMLEN